MTFSSTTYSQKEVSAYPLGFVISKSLIRYFALFAALTLLSLQPAQGFANNEPEGKPEPLSLEIAKLRIENIRLKKQLALLEDELVKLTSNAAQSAPNNTQGGCDAQKLKTLLQNVDGYDKSKLALLWLEENVRRCTTAEIVFLRRELHNWSSYSVAESLFVLEKEYMNRK